MCMVDEFHDIKKQLEQAYLAAAKSREKRIAKLEAYNEKLLDGDIEKHNKIVELEKENAELKEKLVGKENEFKYFSNSFKKKIEELKKEIKDNEDLATVAYMQGAERYRPKWHKVADGDLPKEGEYLVCYETEGGSFRNTFILNYTEYDEDLHWCDEAYETFDEGVIAWCEIPKYMEE